MSLHSNFNHQFVACIKKQFLTAESVSSSSLTQWDACAIKPFSALFHFLVGGSSFFFSKNIAVIFSPTIL
jgi:hypothetical protein